MSDLPSVKFLIQTESSTTREPVSENLVQNIGSSTNFALNTTMFTADWKLNGPIKLFLGQSFVDGIFTFPEGYNWEIFDVAMYGGTMGAGGTTQLNILKATYGSGSYSTIFSTLPQITSAASNGTSVHEGDSVAGCIAPVLLSNPLAILPKDKLMLSVPQVQSGSPRNFGIRVFYRARN